KIVQAWRATGWWPDHYSIATYDIAKTHGGTRLKFTQIGIPPGRYSGHQRGWIETYWTPMKEIFATGTISQQTIRRMQFTDNSFDAAVSTLALDVLPEIEQVVSEMNRVTRPGGIVASAVHQFLGGMTAFDLVINTAAVLDASIREVRDARAGRQQFWPD